jgi:DNA replication protein DnaC
MSTAPTDMKAQLTDNLKELPLPAMRGCFEEQARQAQQESQGYERSLLGLTEREIQARRGRRIERLLRESRLPPGKDLQALDLKRRPPKGVQQIRALTDGAFADRCENVLAFGNPGSGQTHVLSAISHELIRSGRRVYFRNCGLMVQDLLAAKRDLKFTEQAIRDLGSIQPPRLVLCQLEELVLLVEQGRDLKKLLRAKVRAAETEQKPFVRVRGV